MRWAVVLLLLWLLVGPRIEIPVVTGVRVEDLVLAALAAICLAHLRGFARPVGPSLAVAGVVATGLISAAVASARGMVEPVDAVLYAVRPLEYWIAFPAVLLVLRDAAPSWRKRFDAVLVVVTVLQTVFAVLQYYAGIPVGFSHAAYTRAAGLTVGPYELGAISAALVAYWIAHGRWTMAALAAVALAASISRVSILGAGVAVAVLAVAWFINLCRSARTSGWRGALLRHRRPPLLLAGQLASVTAACLVLAFTIGLIHLPTPTPAAPPVVAAPATARPATSSAPTTTPSARPTSAPPLAPAPKAPSDSIARRLESTSILGSWSTAQRLAAEVRPPHDSGSYRLEAYERLTSHVDVEGAAKSGVDVSNLIRFFRWNLILDSFNGPVDVLFGLGPSFVGPSVDGSYLRLYAEGGLVGVLAWVLLAASWFRRTPLWMKCVTITLLVGALFIDIVYAERPMVLFWALLALALTQDRSAGTAADPGVQDGPPSRA